MTAASLPPEDFGNIDEFVRRTQRKAAIKWELDSRGQSTASVCIVDVPLLEDLDGNKLPNHQVMCELITISLDDGTVTVRLAPVRQGRPRLGDGREG